MYGFSLEEGYVGCYSGVRCSLLATSPRSFPSVVSDLLSQLPRRRHVLHLILFNAPILGSRCIARHRLFGTGTHRFFKSDRPTLDCILRPMPSTPLIVRMRDCHPRDSRQVLCQRCSGVPCMLLRGRSKHFVFTKKFRNSSPYTSVRRQSMRTFHRLGKILRGRSFPIGDVVHR